MHVLGTRPPPNSWEKSPVFKFIQYIQCIFFKDPDQTAPREQVIWDVYYWPTILTLLHSERPKFYTILAFLSAVGLKQCMVGQMNFSMGYGYSSMLFAIFSKGEQR